MLRLAGDPAPDWSTLLPRWSAIVGAPLSVDHQVGNIWVLKLQDKVTQDRLGTMASLLQTDPVVQYADPVRRATAKLVPNDPKYNQQWSLSDAVGGVDAPAAWDLQIGSVSTVVAVIDTGITQHPELAGRVLPGYDFISDPASSNDGNGRDNDASDPGDGTSDGECGDGAPGEASSWHGTFVSGIIAANTNNGAGIAGLNWNANILPVRVLGKCGGTFEDIIAGMLWAAGMPVAGAPPNPNPARVINMSLGGATPCAQALQDGINLALAQGVVITVAAGNESDNASDSAPANCSGVITVGASTRAGDRASYPTSANGSTCRRRAATAATSATWCYRCPTTAPPDRAIRLCDRRRNQRRRAARRRHRVADAGAQCQPDAGTRARHHQRHRARVHQRQHLRREPPWCGDGLIDAGLAVASTFPATESRRRGRCRSSSITAPTRTTIS